MQDKTAIGISDLLCQYIEALVEEVVIEGKPFEEQKKWLRKYSEAEGRDYATLEKKLLDFFEVIEEWKQHGLKSSELMAKMLAKECYISEREMEKLYLAPIKTRIQELNGHEYVDLGLPSGMLWATCNVGATKPEEYGDHFAWGETHPKSCYGWESLKYLNSYDKNDNFNKFMAKFIKYTTKDCLKVLQKGDDAAAANWGAGWRMPTKEEWKELYDNTPNRWTKKKAVEGRLFTANNGNSLFLPATDTVWRHEFEDNGGLYWSSSLDTDYHHSAMMIYIHTDLIPDTCFISTHNRNYGLSVRAVHSPCQN